MLRNVFLFLVLTALAATSVLASPTRSARAHARTPKASLHRGAVRAKTAHAVLRTRQVHGRHSRSAMVERASLRRRRPIFFASPLKGSLESLTRQNTMAEAEGLERILDEGDLSDRINQGLLVRVPSSPGIEVSDALPETHRYCRPWTADFLTDLGEAHGKEFHHALFVSSAVRTVEYQKRLMRRNGNAAAAEGDIVSPHLTGATIDIAKKGMSRQELKWMRDWLLPLQTAGKIDVEEEFRQSCFHITVYKSYVETAPEAPNSQADESPVPAAHGA